VSFFLSHFNYIAVAILMMAGLFVLFSSGNLIKRMIGLATFQTSTGLFYISLAKVSAARRPSRLSLAPEARTRQPARSGRGNTASMAWLFNPLPHAMILTAIGRRRR
jgi:multicomponent Na+:H+ antiporter subunit C